MLLSVEAGLDWILHHSQLTFVLLVALRLAFGSLDFETCEDEIQRTHGDTSWIPLQSRYIHADIPWDHNACELVRNQVHLIERDEWQPADYIFWL